MHNPIAPGAAAAGAALRQPSQAGRLAWVRGRVSASGWRARRSGPLAAHVRGCRQYKGAVMRNGPMRTDCHRGTGTEWTVTVGLGGAVDSGEADPFGPQRQRTLLLKDRAPLPRSQKATSEFIRVY